MLYVFTPAAIFPYLAGATVASAFWLVYVVILESSGLGHKRSGILAEEWTAGELRPLRKHGWRLVNHVMLEHSDVDHALVGPGGFFAVETKFRSDWSRAQKEFTGMARAAKASARKLAPKMRARWSEVTPLVVMWGPGLADEFPDVFGYDGVLFCPGGLLRKFLLEQPSCVATEQVESAFENLDAYVTTRDRGERDVAGLPPRSFEQVLIDWMAVAAGWLVCTMAILTLARIRPVGIWAIIGGIAIATASLMARRRWHEGIRIQRVTTATITTACGFSGIYVVVLLFNLWI